MKDLEKASAIRDVWSEFHKDKIGETNRAYLQSLLYLWSNYTKELYQLKVDVGMLNTVKNFELAFRALALHQSFIILQGLALHCTYLRLSVYWTTMGENS